MDLPRDVDDYIKDTIDHSLGIPISIDALQKKLSAAQESQRRLREQYSSLVSRLKEKEQVIELARSESSINAQAVKKFVEENGKLSGECEDLVKQCKKWERECFLYHQDREALMDFGNESDERARESESKVRELEEQVRTMSDVMKKSKVESDKKLEEEERLVDSVLSSFVSEEEIKFGRVFLEANIEDQSLFNRWEELKPSTRKAVSLVAMVKRIEKEKECLILNLAKAEQEVEIVCEQNRELDEENRKLLKQCSSSSGYLQCSAERSNKAKNSLKEPRSFNPILMFLRIQLRNYSIHIFEMDDDGFRNWGYYEPAAATFKGNLGLQLMPSIDRNTKPFLTGRDPNLMIGQNGPYHHHPEPPINMSYNWINQHKDKFFNMLPVTTTPNYGNILPETSSAPSMRHHQTTDEYPGKHEQVEEIVQTNKKRKPNTKAGATTKAKKPRKPKEESDKSIKVKPAKKSVDFVINGVNMDISGLPVPVCTCTGAPQQCYRWGCGGWQSACCTTNISMHPLPMSTKRRGARISGRKMSQGAFKKVLEKLASDGFNFGNPIDLKSHWARHGTNKFVTIR
ncbi:unnamed protein product [Brassica rapa]|uniref:GAGA-binding transcriptional activator n=1 Tax=Brassica campestris TaxID=3711 RepID=A0A3P5YW19_BRACM|nr:unnamed protein product [Brassica rapa]VDC65713.1 unnamed protein product [Brassica rapa]